MLLIVGDGFLRTRLERLRDNLGLENKVRFLGKRNGVKPIFQLCDLFVFPSLFEGSGGNALIEATALDKPSIASNIMSIKEIIEDGNSGVLVKPRSADALARAITYLASNPVLARAMGQRAGENVRDKFSIQRTVPQLEHLYELCVDQHGPGLSAD